jgi:fructokinase
MAAAEETNRIISIGEIVWDMFPRRRILGGAPVNVAYHLASLHHEVTVISRVGNDKLGGEALKMVADLGLSPAGIQRDHTLPTGRVLITVDGKDEPDFKIISPAAWDAIDFPEAAPFADQGAYHLVFGTLAQRDPRSRQTIRSLCARAVRRFYDVNLRPPFTSRKLVLDSLAVADVVKMNGDELIRISGWLGESGVDRQKTALKLMDRFQIDLLVVTEGAEGAWLLSGSAFHHHPGFPVKVVDTVGAGDAFFAALIDGWIGGRAWDESLVLANQRGSYVASRSGATPPMP